MARMPVERGTHLPRARYRDPPDKESPFWNPHSQVIYGWTATEVDAARALSITYDGQVRPRPKRVGYGYLGFRCVRDHQTGSGG